MASVARAAVTRPRTLRVGVFADAAMQPRWLVEAFARLAASEFASITVLALAGARREPPPWLFRAYRRLDRWAFGSEPSELVDFTRRVPHGRFLPAVSAAELRALDLDVAFALGDFDDAELDGVARHGVWRFFFGTEGGEDEILAGYREVARGEPVSACGLKVRVSRGAAPRLAYQSWSRTYPLSVARNRAQLLHKCAEFAHRALRELHRAGARWLEACPSFADCASSAPPGRPRAGEVLRIGGRVARRAALRALCVEQWFLAYRFGAAASALRGDLAGFTRIVPPKDRDWADPFPLERNGRYYVFFEELPYAAGKGHISVLEIGADGRWSQPVPVLERDYHLSYPFLLELDGALYMIPETAQNAAVEIYRCIEFPRRWRLERKLLDGVRCVDATFHRSAERWWMFANVAAGESAVFDDELHLYHAEGLFGEWSAHARNPVKSDARCARPAGRLYAREGALLRPSQVCVPRYGAGLSINRVERLTPHEYVERQVQCIQPAEERGILGLHTVNRAGALTMLDAFTRRLRT